MEGVLILVRDDLSYELLLSPYKGTITDPLTDCVATRIFPAFSPTLIIVNIYSPPARWTAGQGTQEHLLLINRLNLSPHWIITGDFNAHGSWDNHQPCDQLGSKIDDWACDNNLVIANDGSHTRLIPATGGKSTPDVTLVSNSLASDIVWKVGSSCGSDHLPIHFNLVTTPSPSRPAPRARFAFKKADWNSFRMQISQSLLNWSAETESIEGANSSLVSIILHAARRTIPYGNGPPTRVPFWNEKCKKASIDRSNALAKASAPGHTPEDLDRYKEARHSADAIINKEKAAFIREKVSRLGVGTDLWGMVKAIDNRKQSASPAAIITPPPNPDCMIVPKPASTDRQKANLFCKSFAAISRLSKERQTDQPSRREALRATRSCTCRGKKNNMCCPFSLSELESALRQLKKGKSPGLDGISNEMLINLPVEGKAIINRSWTSGSTPAAWRKGVILAIPKKGKDPGDVNSYRPITLLSCISNLAERLVQTRLAHFLESSALLNPNQSGFRKGHSTINQLVKIIQKTFSALEENPPERAHMALLDFSKAYDRVWRDGLIAKMDRLNLPGCLSKWVSSFIIDRRCCVRWGSTLSDFRIFKEGLPQGSVLSPILWLIYINDILPDLPEGIDCSLYADDTAILSTGRSLQSCTVNIQSTLDAIANWTKVWKVDMSPTKCCYTIFTLNPSESNGKVTANILLNGQPLPFNPNPTFLGITLDASLSFAKHAENVKKNMAVRRRCLSALSGKTYGSCRQTLKTTYVAYVRSVWEYGAAMAQPCCSLYQSQIRGRTKCLCAHYHWLPETYSQFTSSL